MSGKMKSKLELAEMIKQLRAELTTAAEEGQDKDVRFTVEDIELELDITVEQQAKANVAAKFYVLTSKVEASKTGKATQKLKIKLKPTTGNGKPLQVSDDDTISFGKNGE